MTFNFRRNARARLTYILIGLLCSIASCESAISKEDPQTLDAYLPAKSDDRPLAGTFCRGAYEVELDDVQGVGIFTKVGKGRRHIGDTLLAVSRRTGGSSWHGTAFDSSFRQQIEADMSLQGDILTVSVPHKGTYQWTRRQPEVAAPVAEERPYRMPHSRRSGSGCSVVQCAGTTKTGRQCRRTTSNCSGYCWQHD